MHINIFVLQITNTKCCVKWNKNRFWRRRKKITFQKKLAFQKYFIVRTTKAIAESCKVNEPSWKFKSIKYYARHGSHFECWNSRSLSLFVVVVVVVVVVNSGYNWVTLTRQTTMVCNCNPHSDVCHLHSQYAYMYAMEFPNQKIHLFIFFLNKNSFIIILSANIPSNTCACAQQWNNKRKSQLS